MSHDTCGWGWDCWHFAATADSDIGRVLLGIAAFGIGLLIAGAIAKRFKL